jgi:molybdopterin molybdotransferase
MVTFELFVRPAIRAMAGRALPFRRTTSVRLAAPVRAGPTLQHFLRAVVDREGTEPFPVQLTGPQGSGILTSMVKANALLIIPEGQPESPAGSLAEAIVLDDPRHQSRPPF